jgi:rRNA maturation protein Nop10
MGLFDKIFKKKIDCKKDGHSFLNGRCAVCGEIKGQYPVSFDDDTWHYDLSYISSQDKHIWCSVCHDYTPHLMVDCKGLHQVIPASPQKGVTYPFPEKHYSICLIHQGTTYCPNCNAFVLSDESTVDGNKIWTCNICGGEAIFHKGEVPQ